MTTSFDWDFPLAPDELQQDGLVLLKSELQWFCGKPVRAVGFPLNC